MHRIYLDNSATSWPKPPSVAEAVVNCMAQTGANPGRSGHSMAMETARLVFNARELIAEFFGINDSRRLVFSHNATHSINTALKGLLRPGDLVAVSPLEHNSVMRPLRKLEKSGIQIQVLSGDKHGLLSEEHLEKQLEENTRMLVVCHASNVTGALQPIQELGSYCRENGITFMIDAAQSAGVIPIDMEKDCIDILAFTGHKGLFGPQGTGGLCLGKDIEPESIIQGGTGSNSELELQPGFLPDRLEPGTPNTPGIAGLAAGVQFIMDTGIDRIRGQNAEISEQLINSLVELGLTVYGPQDQQLRTGPVSFNIPGISPSEVGRRLDRDHGILTRVGLHCSPLAHRTTGTYPDGTVRLSPGFFTTGDEVRKTIQALEAIQRSGSAGK